MVNLLQPSRRDMLALGAAALAASAGAASGYGVNVLIFSGLVLFVITLLVNMFARWIVSRRASRKTSGGFSFV